MHDMTMHEGAHGKTCLFGHRSHHGIVGFISLSGTDPELITVIGVLVVDIKIKIRFQGDVPVKTIGLDVNLNGSDIGTGHATKAFEGKM